MIYIFQQAFKNMFSEAGNYQKGALLLKIWPIKADTYIKNL